MLIEPVIVDVGFPGSVKFAFPPPGSGSAVVSEGAVGTAADDPSAEVALTFDVGIADKSVVGLKIDVDDADAVGVEDQIKPAPTEVLSASPSSGPGEELAWEAVAVSDEGCPSQEVYTAT